MLRRWVVERSFIGLPVVITVPLATDRIEVMRLGNFRELCFVDMAGGTTVPSVMERVGVVCLRHVRELGFAEAASTRVGVVDSLLMR